MASAQITESCYGARERRDQMRAHSVIATNDLANLDMLRSTAVGLVFLGHLLGSMKIRGLGDVGHFGVLLFFVHTSLVLMMSMGRLHLAGVQLYKVFLVRRLFRIYPLSILAVCTVVALRIPSAPWLEGNGFIWPGWPGFLSNLFLVQNVTHSGSVLSVLWSLPFEVQMYATLPLFYVLLIRRPSAWTGCLIWLGGIVAASIEYLVRGESVLDFLLLRYLPCFLAGALAWQLMATARGKLLSWLWPCVLIALILLFRLEDLVRVYGFDWRGLLHGSLRNDHLTWLPASFDLLRDWLFCGVTGMLIPFFVQITNPGLNAITSKIAKYSYGIYVCHVPVLWFCFTLLSTTHLFICAVEAICLTGLISFCLYHLIELPAIQFGKKLSTRLMIRSPHLGSLA